MDNCSIHKSDAIEALIQSVGAKLIDLPPCSPDFFPIENCWSKIKRIFRKIEARTCGDLRTALETALSSVTQKDLLGWFTHCCYGTEEDWQALLNEI